MGLNGLKQDEYINTFRAPSITSTFLQLTMVKGNASAQHALTSDEARASRILIST